MAVHPDLLVWQGFPGSRFGGFVSASPSNGSFPAIPATMALASVATVALITTEPCSSRTLTTRVA